MKKIFLSLITIFMVLSLSVVLVKAEGETTVSLVDGVQIRTDGNNGLRWEAVVNNPKDGYKYGFVYALGDLDALDCETPEALAKEIDTLNDDGTYAITMTKFPKAAATKDISMRAYATDGVNIIYSDNIVVRNLSEVAIEAYETKGLTEGFVKSVYDASITTFNLNDGQLLGEFEFVLQNFDNYTGLGAGTSNGVVPISRAGTRMNYTWKRIVIEYDSELGLWYSVGVGSSTSSADISGSENAYVIGSHSNNTDTQSKAKIDAIFNEVKEGKIYYFNLGTFNLENIPSSSNSWYQHVSADTNPELLVGTSIHLGGGEILPNASKDYYDFAGWFNNAEFNGDKIVNQGKDRNLYAKYTPTKYTITYNLNGGACSTSLVKEYNIESEKITLPTAAEMSIDAGQFVGWYDNAAMNGDAVTEIASGSHGDLELYALWQMDAPTVVELSAADVAVLEKVTPTIIVNKDVKAGKYVVNEVEYSTGSTAFASIDAALSFAKENDIIYVFAGTYENQLTIANKNVSLIGPNYNVHGDEIRYSEAVINSTLNINADNISINGLKFDANGNIKVSGNNVTISNIYMKSNDVKMNTNNRTGLIVNGSSSKISDLMIKDSYLDVLGGTNNAASNGFMAFDDIENLTLDNNVISNLAATTAGNGEGIMIYAMSGFINVINNKFYWCTDGYTFRLGYNSNSCTTINIKDNLFAGSNGNQSATLQIQRGTSALTTNIIGNEFYNFKGGTINLKNDTGSTVYIKYNYYDVNTQFSFSSRGTAVITYENNYYAGGINTNVSPGDATAITSKEALDAAYAEYLSTLE